MKIFHKILIATLPIALVALVAGSWITYYLSRQALDIMTHRWLGTRLNEAVQLVTQHEEFLRLYGVTHIRAGTRKAQYDAILRLSGIRIGDQGYVWVLDQTGSVVFHPDPERVGSDLSRAAWTASLLQKPEGSIRYGWHGVNYLARHAFFEPWGWIIIAADPLDEIYGSMNNARKYILFLAVAGSIGISILTIILARRIVVPLQLLVQGTRRVGSGDLDVSIPVKSSDEIGHLSLAFNVMSRNLRDSLGALRQSERYFRSLTENSSDLIALLSPEGTIRYLSPSITRLLGFRSRELKGSDFSKLMEPQERLGFERFLLRLEATPTDTLSRECVLLNHRDERRIFEISGRNLMGVPGVEGLVLNSRDITSRKTMENELKASELQLHHLSSRLISAQEKERKRLSVELHDEVGQSLAILKLNVIMLEEGLDPKDQERKNACEDLVASIDNLIENVRRLSRDLAPSAIQDLGLPAALMWLADTIKKHYTVTADIRLGSLDDQIPLDNQILIYRIFQEAISNAVKHAGATRISLSARKENEVLIFEIKDNGKGFNPVPTTGLRQGSKGLGLPTMRERARMLGGKLIISSSEESGTLLQFTVPVDKTYGHGLV